MICYCPQRVHNPEGFKDKLNKKRMKITAIGAKNSLLSEDTYIFNEFGCNINGLNSFASKNPLIKTPVTLDADELPSDFDSDFDADASNATTPARLNSEDTFTSKFTSKEMINFNVPIVLPKPVKKVVKDKYTKMFFRNRRKPVQVKYFTITKVNNL